MRTLLILIALALIIIAGKCHGETIIFDGGFSQPTDMMNYAPQVPNTITNALPAIEAIATNPKPSFADNISVDIGVFVNTRAAQPKNTLIAGMVSYSTGSNTFLGLGAFAGERFKGGAEVVGGLKSEGSIHIPIVNYTLHTSQWVADGLAYVSGISGTQAYGITIQSRHGWENYFVSTIVAHINPKFSVGISSLIIGPDIYLGGGVGYRF